MGPVRTSVVVRWIIAMLVCAGGFFLLARVMSTEVNWLAIFAKSLFGFAALISGVILAAPELVQIAVSPIHRLLDSILLPSETEPPPLDFTLARLYGQRMRYDDACEEYAKIIRHHPDSREAYLEGIHVAVLAGNLRLARKFHRQAQRVMRADNERHLLERVYLEAVSSVPAR